MIPALPIRRTSSPAAQRLLRAGLTTVACMPNTKPVLDTPEQMEYVLEKGKHQGFCHVLPIGAVTVGQKGRNVDGF